MTLMGEYEVYIITAGVFLFIFACLWAILKWGKYKQETGTGRERLTEARAGREFVQAEKAITQEQAAAEAEEKKEEHIAAEVEAEEKGEPSEAKKAAEEAEVEEIKGAEAGAKVEEESEAVTGRTIGLVAALKVISNVFARYLFYRKGLETKEEQELPVLRSLMNKIASMKNYGNIDARAAQYLASFVEKSLGKYLDNLLKTEEGKAKEMKNALGFLKETVAEMVGCTRGARGDLTRLSTEARKERKKFDKEIKAGEKAIKAKRKELKAASKQKEADPSIIAGLKREIALAEGQAKSAHQINGKLKATFKFMKKEVSEMKKLLRKVLRAERAQKKYDRRLKKRDDEVEKRVEGLSDAVGEIKKHIQSLSGEGANPQLIVTELSADLNRFFDKFKEVIKADMEFDEVAKDIIIRNIVIGEQIQAFEKLEESLTESEEAVEKGAEALKKILDAITGAGGAEAAIDAEVMKALEQSSGRIAYEEKIQRWMDNMTKRIEDQTAAESAKMGNLIEMDKKTLAEAEASRERNSKHLGQAMATMVARKEAIDAEYRPQAEAFGAQLEKRNEIAAAAYKEARQAERRAA